jgi:hypothetical protein
VRDERAIRLGLRENLAQFSLLAVVNAFVGAMVGLERAILPAIAEAGLPLADRAAILSFIVVFGVFPLFFAAGMTLAEVGYLAAAIWAVAAITLASGVVVAVRMRETLRPSAPRSGAPDLAGIRGRDTAN